MIRKNKEDPGDISEIFFFTGQGPLQDIHRYENP